MHPVWQVTAMLASNIINTMKFRRQPRSRNKVTASHSQTTPAPAHLSLLTALLLDAIQIGQQIRGDHPSRPCPRQHRPRNSQRRLFGAKMGRSCSVFVSLSQHREDATFFFNHCESLVFKIKSLMHTQIYIYIYV